MLALTRDITVSPASLAFLQPLAKTLTDPCRERWLLRKKLLDDIQGTLSSSPRCKM